MAGKQYQHPQSAQLPKKVKKPKSSSALPGTARNPLSSERVPGGFKLLF